MKYDSFTNQPTGTARRRRSIRLKGYDYSQAGAYFITQVTHQRACLFGHIVDGEMGSDDMGRIVEEQWLHSAEVRPNIELDEFVIMPNHFHGILVIVDDVGPGAVVGASRRLATTNRRTRNALYALKAAKNAGKSIDAERKWQNEQLPPENRGLVLTARSKKKNDLKI